MLDTRNLVITLISYGRFLNETESTVNYSPKEKYSNIPTKRNLISSGHEPVRKITDDTGHDHTAPGDPYPKDDP